MPLTSIRRQPWRRSDRYSRAASVRTDRLRDTRRPPDLPLRLRLGADLFPGHAHDLTARGIGMWFVPQPDPAHNLDHALAGHERGALELPIGEMHLVVRVRIAHVRFVRDASYVGLAIDDISGAERLIRRLEAYAPQ